jgi:hypothetical protein
LLEVLGRDEGVVPYSRGKELLTRFWRVSQEECFAFDATLFVEVCFELSRSVIRVAADRYRLCAWNGRTRLDTVVDLFRKIVLHIVFDIVLGIILFGLRLQLHELVPVAWSDRVLASIPHVRGKRQPRLSSRGLLPPTGMLYRADGVDER